MNYDVVILGSGIAGSILAAILSKAKVSSLMIDSGQHPRFAIGESTIPGTTYLLRVMAERYDIPELDQCSTFLKLRRNVTSSSGIKRNFSFVHHQKGKKFDPKKSTMLPVPHYPHGPESHLMRQDVDAWLHNVAINYGADSFANLIVESIDEEEQGMLVKTKDGRAIRAKYIVDASGYRSVLADKFDLREVPSRLQTNSRSLFTHMVGVKHFDEFYSHSDHGLPQPLSQGTLHHIFDGGWLWVIPFNNHESSTNPLCSVGLQLDPRKFPKDSRSPEQEFRDFLDGYPEIKQQFSHARSVRGWVSTSRLQFSSKQVVGNRFILMAHAAGFIDPLFSRGLYITMEAINALGKPLIEAVRDNDFANERFAHLESLTQGLIDAHDKVVNGSFISFRDFDLWNAWYRVWALGGTYSSLRFRSALSRYKRTNRKEYLEALDFHPMLGSLCPDLDHYHHTFNQAYQIMIELESGSCDTSDAIDRLYELYRNKSWIPPIYQLDNPESRFISHGNFLSFIKSNLWGYFYSPREIREKYYNFPVAMLFGALINFFKAEKQWYKRICIDFRYPRHKVKRRS